MNIREEVQWFSEQMEKKLKANDHKQHWSNSELDYLVRRLDGEFDELINALGGLEFGFNIPEDVIQEAADIANFAMMIADNVSGRKRLLSIGR